MSVIFLFIDGVGLGKENNENPFFRREYEAFIKMAGEQPFSRGVETVNSENHLFKPVDARLNVEGLPQSGTGQTALLSGKNASKEIGKHFGPFPHTGIKHLLKNESLFIKSQQRGKSCHFINAYPDIFFNKAEKRDRWSCTTLMTKSADVSLNTTEDVKKGEAVTAGITQQAWREKLDIDVPVIEPETAADRLLKKAEEEDLVLSEYYLTDKAGHSRDKEKADHVLSVYDRFLKQLILQKRKRDTILLTSDHGNLEDLSVKTHTLNKVPLFVYGPGAKVFKEASSILDVTPGILRVLESETG